MDGQSDSLRHRAEILSALLAATADPQAVTGLAAASANEAEFVASVTAAFSINSDQALAIADMHLRRLFADSRDYLRADLDRIAELQAQQRE